MTSYERHIPRTRIGEHAPIHLLAIRSVGHGAVVAALLIAGCAANETKVASSSSGLTMERALDAHFQSMDGIGEKAERDWNESLEDLRSREGIVQKVVSVYDTQSGPALDERDLAQRAELRWKAIHLLGYLGDTGAIKPLYRIATKPLPNPEASARAFEQEYRVRLAAIDALERLAALPELQELYQEQLAQGAQGLLRGPAAAALFELGRAPEGVVELDPAKAIPSPDPTKRHRKEVPTRSVQVPSAPLASTVEGG